MSPMPALEFESDLPPFSVQKSLATIAQTHRKSYTAQLAEMIWLIFGEGKLSRREYYRLRLYDDEKYSFEDKKNFVGWRNLGRFDAIFADVHWESAATDKLVFHGLMASLGSPVPETRAIYRRSADFPALTSLSTPEALGAYLRTAEHYPFFSKPAAERRSIGIASVESYDRAADKLIFANGRRVRIGDFVAAVDHFAEGGYLFQERLQPHDAVARICGDRLATMRIIILLDDTGPEIFRAVWKLPGGDNVADNFWRAGNIVAAIDPESGRTWRAVTGGGPDLRELDIHPDSGEPIKDIDVPLWFEARDLCLAAATALPQIRMQAWDVAATSRGPVLIEVNTRGDLLLPQLAAGRGILDTRFRRFIADRKQERRIQEGRKQLHHQQPSVANQSGQLGVGKVSETPVLEIGHDRSFSLRQSLAAVARTHGKGYAAQLSEMMKLRVGKGGPSLREYFYYRLYDDVEYSAAEKGAFAGWRTSGKVHPVVNDLRWRCCARDKLIFYSFIASLGFPVPETRAVYRRSAAFPALTSLSTPAAVGQFLRTTDLYPFFSKPAGELESIGVASVESYDRATDGLVFANGRRVAVDAFVAAVEHFAESGYLFQERLRPHADVARICGDRLATMRIVVLLDGDKPEIFRAVWKLPVGDNVADNFWREGNIIAAIDPESGRTWRAVTGTGLDLRQVDTHPGTGATIKDIEVPLWSEARNLCLAAATALPQIRMQAWDVAATSRGPVLIEVNPGGDYNLPQLATGRGILDDRFRRFVAECQRKRRTQKGWLPFRTTGRG